jgi:hypothetical protein
MPAEAKYAVLIALSVLVAAGQAALAYGFFRRMKRLRREIDEARR